MVFSLVVLVLFMGNAFLVIFTVVHIVEINDVSMDLVEEDYILMVIKNRIGKNYKTKKAMNLFLDGVSIVLFWIIISFLLIFNRFKLRYKNVIIMSFCAFSHILSCNHSTC